MQCNLVPLINYIYGGFFLHDKNSGNTLERQYIFFCVPSEMKYIHYTYISLLWPKSINKSYP